MSVTGTYSGTDLTLDLSISDGIDTDTLNTGAFSAASYEGAAMGLRARSGQTTGGGQTVFGTTVEYDNFSVIPEPGTLVLTGLALCGLLVSRRVRIHR